MINTVLLWLNKINEQYSIFSYLELKKSIFASSLSLSARSSVLSCPSLVFKNNNEILQFVMKKLWKLNTINSTEESV